MGFTHTLILLLALSSSADPLIGTWKLNVGKSKFGSGPEYKSILVKIETQGNRVKYIVDSLNSDGHALHYNFTLDYDGKDYPVNGNPSADAVAARRIDANSVELVFKQGGKAMVSRHEVISNGGRTRTVTTSGKDSMGRNIDGITVFDKQ